MFRIVTPVVAALSLTVASCCCTSDSKPPSLRPAPKFKEIEPAFAPESDPVYTPIRATK